MKIFLLVWLTVAAALAGAVDPAAIAARLPEQPCGIGRQSDDRDWWGRWAESPEGAAVVKRAEGWMKQEMPGFDEEKYLDFSISGDRVRYQTVNSRRWDRFKWLVLGECIEDKGRFLPELRKTIESLCADPSWVLPAHDRNNAVFKGEEPYVDLAAAANGHDMALAAWLLEKRLPEETVRLMRGEVRRRIVDPVFRTIDGTAPKHVRSGHWWARANMNWNAVCTSGVVGAVLATEPSREKRAKAVAWAAGNMDVFLSGFGSDGYCSEGIGYWNYGFSHYVVLEELLRSQTGGVVDLFRAPSVKAIAAAPADLELSGGVFPAFADCALDSKPDSRLIELIRWRIDGRPFAGNAFSALKESGQIYQILVSLVARDGARVAGAGDKVTLPRVSRFPESGVFVCRPAKEGGMAVAWKGGHNDEHHNHNDVGTTVVAWKGRAVIADPGAMVYRAETFSKDRYRLPVMSSFAHSVPVVAGFLQSQGRQCRGVLGKTSFTDECANVCVDLSSAYPGKPLKALTREWSYQHGGDGCLVIEDRVGFTTPSAFATALVALGDWHLIGKEGNGARFRADGGGGAVIDVLVECSHEADWDVRRIPNPGKPQACRLGLSLRQPVEDGWIRMTLRPSPEGLGPKAVKLPVLSVPEKLADAARAP